MPSPILVHDRLSDVWLGGLALPLILLFLGVAVARLKRVKRPRRSRQPLLVLLNAATQLGLLRHSSAGASWGANERAEIEVICFRIRLQRRFSKNQKFRFVRRFGDEMRLSCL